MTETGRGRKTLNKRVFSFFLLLLIKLIWNNEKQLDPPKDIQNDCTTRKEKTKKSNFYYFLGGLTLQPNSSNLLLLCLIKHARVYTHTHTNGMTARWPFVNARERTNERTIGPLCACRVVNVTTEIDYQCQLLAATTKRNELFIILLSTNYHQLRGWLLNLVKRMKSKRQ